MSAVLYCETISLHCVIVLYKVKSQYYNYGYHLDIKFYRPHFTKPNNSINIQVVIRFLPL